MLADIERGDLAVAALFLVGIALAVFVTWNCIIDMRRGSAKARQLTHGQKIAAALAAEFAAGLGPACPDRTRRQLQRKVHSTILASLAAAAAE